MNYSFGSSQGDVLDEGKPMAELLQTAVSQNIHSNEGKHLSTMFGSVEKKTVSI